MNPERQFVIERPCFDGTAPDGYSGSENWAELLPICVWVTIENPLGNLNCGAPAYRILTEFHGVSEDGRTFAIHTAPGYTPTICEHMGHWIE